MLHMEIRAVSMDERTITGVCAPYDEVSYLVPDPSGERIRRGAFTKSLRQRADKVLLFRGHDHSRAVARSRTFDDNERGLVGIFHARPSAIGDEALEEARDGYLPGMSVGFKPLQMRRGDDGVREVVEAALLEVSLVTIPAYEGAAVLAVRGMADEVLPFAPVVLDDGPPLMPWWA
jgi:HK97 family phage prohead protease